METYDAASFYIGVSGFANRNNTFNKDAIFCLIDGWVNREECESVIAEAVEGPA